MLLRATKSLVTAALVVYAIPLTAWLVLRQWQGETWTYVAWMNAAGLLWFAPLLVLLPVALLVRARQASLMGALILLPALLLFGGDFVPRLGAAPDGGVPLRVLSFNALFVNHDPSAVEALIREHQPDVVAIQELSPELADYLNAQVGDAYPYRLLYPWNDPRGIGLWSRYPLHEGTALHHPYWERWAQSAVVDVEGRALHLYNVHLWPIGTLDRSRFARALAVQQSQARTLRDVVTESPMPVLVVGDFNASPTNETYAIVDETLDDAWRTAGLGPGFTFPSPGHVERWTQPFLRIDYFWTRGDVTPLDVAVLPPAGSDHLPMLGEFLLR